MKSFFVQTLIVLFALTTHAQDAATILAKMDKIIFSPKDKTGTIEIIITEKDGKQKIREAEMFQKGADKKLYRYTKPESQKGIATLSLPGNVMWMSMPALDKPRRISMLSNSQAFNGTDFSFEDMPTTPYSERFTPTIESSNSEEYILNLIPLSNKSNYTKIILKVHKVNGYPIEMHYYNELGIHFKMATYTYEKIGKYWNASEIVMKNIEKNHSTTIRLTNIKFDQGLADDLFLVENLKK